MYVNILRQQDHQEQKKAVEIAVMLADIYKVAPLK